MTNFLRTNYRITGNSIDSGSLAIAAGSSTTSTAAAAVGEIAITHGLATTPTFAIASPIAGNTLQAAGRKVHPLGMGATTISFICATAMINESAIQTAVSSAFSSKLTMSFVWAAFG